MTDELLGKGRDLNTIVQHAQQLQTEYSARDSEAEEYERMYLMEWKDQPKGDGIKATMSPDARNSVLGVTRLLTATDPIFAAKGNEKGKDKQLSRIEQACADMWDISGRIGQSPVHYDAVLSAALYAEVHIPITSTADLVEHARKAGRGQKRAERIAQMTPFLFEIWNPRYGYPEFDGLGLTAYYRRVEVYASDLQSRFGEDGARIASGHAKYDRLWLNVFYDMDEYAVWVDSEGVIFHDEHGLPSIPVAVSIAEGSRLFEKPEQQRQPHLYTIRKSGIWDRQNLALTVLYTHLFNIGINPTFVYTRPPGDTDSEPYHDAQNGLVMLNNGADYKAMASKGIIDESFQVALDIAERKFGESTIYRQALGEPLTGSQPYSTVALLSQSGRLPLVSIQRRTAWCIADAMATALEWWKTIGGGAVKGIDLSPSEIPNDLDLEVKLDVSLPQDKLQQSNIAISLAQTGMTSKEWVRENILNIGQSDQMDTEIWDEQAAQAMHQAFVEQQLQQMQMQQQQAQMQQAQAQQQMMQQGQMMQPGQGQGQGFPPQGQRVQMQQPPDEMEMMG